VKVLIDSLSHLTAELTDRPVFRYFLVTGDRNYSKAQVVEDAVVRHWVYAERQAIYVNGAQKGADSCCSLACLKHQIPFYSYPAQFIRLGRKAGPIRNELMFRMHGIELVLCFHDSLRNSRGSYGTCEIALKRGIPVKWYELGTVRILTNLSDLPSRVG
jgi:hypothetical protein